MRFKSLLKSLRNNDFNKIKPYIEGLGVKISEHSCLSSDWSRVVSLRLKPSRRSKFFLDLTYLSNDDYDVGELLYTSPFLCFEEEIDAQGSIKAIKDLESLIKGFLSEIQFKEKMKLIDVA